MSWQTTFYYQQELRSSYMNNLIKGLIKPGIYNIDAYISTVANGQEEEQAGVYLNIKKGTTLVFSNSYDTVGGRRIRNLEGIGSYVVKCVLDTDLKIALSTNAASNATNPDYLNSIDRIPVVFVHAEFYYNPNENSNREPNITIAAPTYYGENFPAMATKKLPNEDLLVSGGGDESSADYSYLILGALIDKSVEEGGGEGRYGDSGRGWDSNAARLEWMNNHVFTGRSFPDYKGSQHQNFGPPMMSFGYSPSYNKIFLTEGQFYYDSTMYSISGVNWKSLYGQGTAGEATPYGGNPNATTGYIVDGVLRNSSDNTFDLESPIDGLDPGEDNGKLIVDFLFMGLKSEHSRGSEGEETYPNLVNLFTASNVKRRLYPVRVVCDDPGVMNFNTNVLRSEDANSIAGLFGENARIIPLDVSKTNVNRLRSLFLNKNILLRVADYIRQTPHKNPYFEPDTAQSLLPIFVAFRKVKHDGEAFYVDDVQSSLDALENDLPAINPANILSFIDVQHGSNTLTGVSFLAQESYTTLPILGD